MLLPLIFGVLLGGVVVIFALQNITVITVSFFAWQIEGSLSLILMTAVVVGMAIALLFVLPESIRNYFRNRNHQRENANLAEELRKQKELTVFAKNTPYVPEGETPAETEPVI